MTKLGEVSGPGITAAYAIASYQSRFSDRYENFHASEIKSRNGRKAYAVFATPRKNIKSVESELRKVEEENRRTEKAYQQAFFRDM